MDCGSPGFALDAHDLGSVASADTPRRPAADAKAPDVAIETMPSLRGQCNPAGRTATDQALDERGLDGGEESAY